MQSVKVKVLRRIYGKGRGWVFTRSHFLDLGSADSIRKALESLCDAEVIRRLARGIYDYPDQHPRLGQLLPTAEKIAVAIAGRDKAKLQPAGAYAANLLGLTLQVPAQVVFLTDGASRSVEVGNQTIVLKRTTPKNMAAAGRISGLVIQALRHIGRDHVTKEMLEILSRRLSNQDAGVLHRDAKLAPAWIAKLIHDIIDQGK